MSSRFSLLAASLAVAGILALQGCGGGSSGDSGSSSSAASSVSTAQKLSGTVAYGAPLANATVTLTDATGKQVSTTSAADGSYELDVAGLTAPFFVQATGQSGEETRSYSALVATTPAKGSTATVNVTPLTTAIVALASSSGSNPAEFASPAALAGLDTKRLEQAVTAVKTLVSEVVKAYDKDATNFDPVSTPFKADTKSAGDKLLDAVKVTLSNGAVTVTNALVPVGSSGAETTATVTITDVTKTTVTALAKPVVTTTSANDVLTLLRTQLNACLALDPTARVTLDASNNPTALLGACSASALTAIDKTYYSNGTDLLGNWGPKFRDYPKGATVGLPEIIYTSKAADGKVSITARLPITAKDGNTSTNVLLTSDTKGDDFKLLGNQRKYNLGVSARLFRYLDVSPYPRIGTSNGVDAGKNVGKLSRYEAGLTISFNPELPAAAKVYAIRVKGPSLPDAGLVMARSASCGTGDYLAVFSSDGTLPDASGKTAAFAATASTTNSWRFAASPIGTAYKGTDLWNELRGYASKGVVASSAPATMPGTPTNYRETPYDVSKIGEFPAYVFEVFSVDAPSTPESFTVYMTDKPRAPATGDQNVWPELTAASLAYLDPSLGNAKAQPFTSATIDWTLADNAQLVGNVSMSGNTRNAANASVRYNLSETVRPVGAKTMKIGFGAETDGLGQACANSSTPALSATTGSRNIDLRQQGYRVTFATSYAYSGRDASTAPVAKAGGDGWNAYSADLHPIVPGAVSFADGYLGQFAVSTSSGYLNPASVSGGLLTLATTAAVADRASYYLSNVMDSSDTYPKSLTFLAQVAGDSSTASTQRVLDMQLSWVPRSAPADADGRRSGIYLPITIRNNTAAGTGGMVAASITTSAASGSCKAGSDCNYLSTPLDTSVSHIYQVVLTLTNASSGSVKVYVDGGATPVLEKAVGDGTTLAFRTTSTTSTWSSQLLFGDLNSSATYSSKMDWLIWKTGAFTPAELKGKLPSNIGTTTGY